MKISVLSTLSAKLAVGTIATVAAIGVLSEKVSALTLVDTELFLSIDVSGSIDTSEFNLQKQGYVNAFNDSAIQAQISSLPKGLAVALGYWSSANQQNVAVNWRLLRNAADATNFANLINATTRPFDDNTAPGNAIQYAANQLLNNDYDGKKIIDVSGDGEANTGIDTLGARNAAAAQGITINGLPIGNAGLQAFYQNNIVTSDGFLVAANDFNDFDVAIRRKIQREITGDAVPTPALIPGLIGLGIGAWRKRRNQTLAAA
jgi:hypothetical protein